MYLGLDIGTSSIKALLLDRDMRFVATASQALTVQRPYEGWSEQDPKSWCDAIETVMGSLRSQAPQSLSEVVSIGLSGQMHGLVALDENHDILRPAILWNDARNEAEAKELDTSLSAFRTIGGNAVMPGFTAPKALWMARHEPDLFDKIHMILLPKDYVRFWLSGEMLTDMSDASGTLWMDTRHRTYSDELLSHCHLRPDQVPELREGHQAAGQLKPELATKWGMKGAPVIAGGSDNASAACGLGVVNAGDAFLSLGTSGVVFAVTDHFAPSAHNGAHAFCHALSHKWHQMGVILSATDSLNWLSEMTGQTVSQLAKGAASIDIHSAQIYFHPYLSGERTPHNDAHARGGFFQLSRAHGVGHMAFAVLEGVAYALADCVDVLSQAGSPLTEVIATGGGAKNAQWLQMIADITSVRIAVPVSGDFGAALGAARLGALATGRREEDILTKPEIAHIYEPRADLFEIYKARRSCWQSLYHTIKEVV